MSDLISKEALLKVIRDDRLTNASDAIYFITNAPAIEQGEAVAYERFSDGEKKWISVSFEDLAHYQSKGQKIRDLYTTPQQPQSVADALEEAAKVMRTTLTGRCWETDIQKAEHAVRALIKRNAVKEGE